jgi:hypothetical protein
MIEAYLLKDKTMQNEKKNYEQNEQKLKQNVIGASFEN